MTLVGTYDLAALPHTHTHTHTHTNTHTHTHTPTLTHTHTQTITNNANAGQRRHGAPGIYLQGINLTKQDYTKLNECSGVINICSGFKP